MAEKTLMSLILAMLLIGCGHSGANFNEEAWRRGIDSTDRKKLYAPHFRDGRFFNPWNPMDEKGIGDLLKWRFSRKKQYTPEEERFLPRIHGNALKRIRAMGSRDFILWIGHDTHLIRLEGRYWIVDPIFSERALLPKRKTPPGMSLEDLRSLSPDLRIIITHNHYDHLDADSVEKLPRTARVYVPLGLGDTVRKMNKPHTVEMDWWQTLDAGGGQKLVCLPAQHWSRRVTQGVNRSLWASYLLVSGKRKIYIAGDSGYFAGYREIGRRFPGIDYALLRITAYHPRWFMHYAHMDVRESLDAFGELKARFFIPTQWGTFPLGDEPVGYGALDLMMTVHKRGLDPSRFLIMGIGEILPLESEGRAGK